MGNMSKRENILAWVQIAGFILFLVAVGFALAAVNHRSSLRSNLVELQITETKLSIEKLNFELSIYREQELIVANAE